jgi:hypothetical protein
MQTDEETFRTYLLLYKHKTRNLVWQSGPPLSGEYETGADVDFYLDNVCHRAMFIRRTSMTSAICVIYLYLNDD